MWKNGARAACVLRFVRQNVCERGEGAMAVRATERHRAKISVTVNPQLLQAVDAFVAEQEGWDRSKVIDEALRLWCAREQERAMEEQYAVPQSPEEQEERAAWREIHAAAAERLFRPR